MNHKLLFPLAILALAPLSKAAPDQEQVRESAAKAVRLMQSSMADFTPKAPCASCHHNIFPTWVLKDIQRRGVPVNEQQRKEVAIRSFSYLKDVDRAIQGTFYVDPVMENAENLAFGKEMGIEPSVTTALHTRRMASLQKADGRFATFDGRPPQSYSSFMITALAVRTMNQYLPASMAEEKDARIERARAWLATAPVVSTEDSSYRVMGLVWASASRAEIGAAADDLLSRQNADGGWAQTSSRKSDAYATGEAMYALKLAGASRQAYNRGVQFLLDTQLQDGSWLVETRLHEVAQISPPKMETGFPHGPSQITSMFGTTWAVYALSLALPEQPHAELQLAEVHATAEPWVEIAAFGTLEQLSGVDTAAHTKLGSTPLMVAANDVSKTVALLARGADIAAKAKSGHTALSVSATYGGAAPVMRQLVAAGASAKPEKGVEYNSNPLVFVDFADDAEAAAILLDAGASMHQPMMLQGLVQMTPLTGAVQMNATAVLKEYLKRGADPNTVEEVPLLSRAVIANRPEAAKILIEAGADPDAVDRYGWTPLQHVQGVEHDVDQMSALIREASEARRTKVSGGGAAQ
jgi:hypothetical protein